MSASTSAVPTVFLANYDEINDLELPEPTARPNPISGTPMESIRVLYEDPRCTIGVWEASPGAFPGLKDGIGEQATITSGRATLHGDDGTTLELVPGVSYVTPDGWSGRWEVAETVRKYFAVWRT